jgi:hypothetical protein
MAHPFHHAISSAKKFGGEAKDYQAIHDWFDATKEHYANWRHRAMRHHSFGIYEAERVFGTTITNSNGRQIPVRLIGEQHVTEDLGLIPTMADWLRALGDPAQIKPWMTRGVQRDISRIDQQPNELEKTQETQPACA